MSKPTDSENNQAISNAPVANAGLKKHGPAGQSHAVAGVAPKRMRVSSKLKKQIYVSFGGVYTAGFIYWMSRLFFKHQGEYGPEPSTLENWAGPIHLIFAFLFVSVMGIVWTLHISPALRSGRQRWTGWVFLSWVVFLALSGIGILYGRESVVSCLEQIHPWIGVVMLPTLIIHWRGRRH